MYSGVPTAMPLSVSASSPAAVDRARHAEVGHQRVPLPSEPPGGGKPASRMLPGFTSRWTMPLAWAKLSASATSRAILSVSGSGSCTSRAMRSRSESPGM